MIDEPAPLVVKGLKIAEELFTTGFRRGEGPFNCTSRCCHRGAYMDVAERDLLIKHADLIQPHLDATQSHDLETWFEHEEKVDPDYASGRCVGTGTVNGKCAFQNEKGWCTVQIAGAVSADDKWAIKPAYCVTFPLEVVDGWVRFNAMMQGKEQCCSVHKEFDTPLFEACREELIHLVGEDGYQQVEAAYGTRTRVGTERHDRL
jgi:hypothetical protein